MSDIKWFCDGRRCDADLHHILEEKRAEKRKRSVLLHRAIATRRQEAKDERALKAALRRLVRVQERELRISIRAVVQPRWKMKRAGGGSLRRNHRLETMLGLGVPKRRGSRGGRLSSFHLRFRSRGLGDRRRNRSHVFRPGETVKALRYILREAAREIADGGVVSNLSTDPAELAACFDALESLERQDRSNAHVYSMIVVSLPHELDPTERLDVLRSICTLLGEHDLGHVGVLHAPDPEGDARNFHAHILLSWRPIERIGPTVFAFSAEKHSDLNDASFILPFRQRVETILNDAMAKAGHDRRYTALSAAERGLPPRTKASGKSTPGQKAVERKQRQLDAMIAERDALVGLRDGAASLDDLSSRLATIGRSERIATANTRGVAAGQTAEPNVTRPVVPLDPPSPAAIVAATRPSLEPNAPAVNRDAVAPVAPSPPHAITPEIVSHSPSANPIPPAPRGAETPPPVVVIPSSTPHPVAEPAQASERPRDPARDAFLGRLRDGLAEYAYLPLREIPRGRDPSAAPTFELHIRDRERSDLGFLLDADRMSEDPTIQAEFQRAYDRMLRDAGAELTSGRATAPDTGERDIGRQMQSRDLSFRDAVAVARGDAAFEAMLAQVRSWWDRQQREAETRRRERARSERQRALEGLDIATMLVAPALRTAFERVAIEIVEGRILLTAKEDGVSLRFVKGLDRQDAQVVMRHVAGRQALALLAKRIAIGANGAQARKTLRSDLEGPVGRGPTTISPPGHLSR